MEIGSKMAEKNSAQTNRQTDKPTDTTKIMVTWPWTNSDDVAVVRLFRPCRPTAIDGVLVKYLWTPQYGEVSLDWLTELMFYIPLHILETFFLANLLA